MAFVGNAAVKFHEARAIRRLRDAERPGEWAVLTNGAGEVIHASAALAHIGRQSVDHAACLDVLLAPDRNASGHEGHRRIALHLCSVTSSRLPVEIGEVCMVQGVVSTREANDAEQMLAMAVGMATRDAGSALMTHASEMCRHRIADLRQRLASQATGIANAISALEAPEIARPVAFLRAAANAASDVMLSVSKNGTQEKNQIIIDAAHAMNIISALSDLKADFLALRLRDIVESRVTTATDISTDIISAGPLLDLMACADFCCRIIDGADRTEASLQQVMQAVQRVDKAIKLVEHGAREMQ